MRTLRAMLREAREGGVCPGPGDLRARWQILRHPCPRAPPPLRLPRRASAHLTTRSCGTPIRAEIRLFASELATDLARFPVLREWTTDDLLMLSGLFVDAMIAAIKSLLEATDGRSPPAGPRATPEAEISGLTQQQLRLMAHGVPQWRSSG